MDMNMLKTQVMTMFMMKSSQPKQPGQKNDTMSDLFALLYSMMLMNVMEWIFKHLPIAIEYGKTLLEAKFKPKKENWLPLTNKSAKEKEQLNSITMTRIFSTKTERAENAFVEKVDAVLDYICGLDDARHVRMDVRYTLNNTEEIELTPLLKAKVKQSTGSGVAEDMTIELVVFSTILKVSDIRSWIDDVHSNYVAEKNNKLGNKIFYFNEIPIEPVKMADMSDIQQPQQQQQQSMDAQFGSLKPPPRPKMSYRWDNMPKQITFSMNEFKTSKSFNNVYGTHVDELKERLNLFVNHPDWYMDRGIPHSLGILLYGVPGAGKTSTIKAIAKDTNRHIFNLSLREYTTQRQLTTLFFNENVSIHNNDGSKQTLKIPLNRRVYVIEDVDCLTDVVLDRQLTGNNPNSAGVGGKEGEAVTLSFLLNLLDGVLETPGRILIMTSNYPEKLDRALVRPGRIDVKIEFKNASLIFIQDMINKFYSTQLSLEDIPVHLDSVFTPAEIMESMCTHFKSQTAALEHLIKKAEAKQLLEAQNEFGTRLKELGFATPTATSAAGTPPIESPVDSETASVVSEEPPPSSPSSPSSPPPPPSSPTPLTPAPTLRINEIDTGLKNASIVQCATCKSHFNVNYLAARGEHYGGKCRLVAPRFTTTAPLGAVPIKYPRRAWFCDNGHNDLEMCDTCSTQARMNYPDDKPLKIHEEINRSFGIGAFLGAAAKDDIHGTALFEGDEAPEGAGGWFPGMSL
jgi:hypothetical protein